MKMSIFAISSAKFPATFIKIHASVKKYFSYLCMPELKRWIKAEHYNLSVELG